MAQIIRDDDEGQAVVDRSTATLAATPVRSTSYKVFREDSYWLEVLGSKIHPDLVRVLKKLNARDTGSFIDWDWIARYMVSVKGDVFRVSEGYRTPERQAELYAQGRHDSKRIVTKAKPYQSYHNWGLAVDLVPTKYGYTRFVAGGEVVDLSRPSGWLRTGIPQYLKSEGLGWGGYWAGFEDCPHVELVHEVPLDDTLSGSPWWLTRTDLVRITAPRSKSKLWLAALALGAIYIAGKVA